MTDPTPEMVALAPRIAKRLANEPDEAYSNEVYLAALAAIIETSEMAAKWHDRQAGIATDKCAKVLRPDSQLNYAAGAVTCKKSATALRAYDHIKPENG